MNEKWPQVYVYLYTNDGNEKTTTRNAGKGNPELRGMRPSIQVKILNVLLCITHLIVLRAVSKLFSLRCVSGIATLLSVNYKI